MPFPAPTEHFPPRSWATVLEQYGRNEAWYVGDQSLIQQAYPERGNGSVRSGSDSAHYNHGGNAWRRFLSRGHLANLFNSKPIGQSEGRNRARLHIPVWANVATLSADMILSEGAAFRMLGRDEGKAVKGPAQRRLDEILNGERTRMALLEAAELAAGLSAVALTAHWNPATSDAPWIEVTPCDAVIPEFEGGRLVAANLYTRHHVVDTFGIIQGVYVHVERHEPGAVVHGLLKMDGDLVTAIVPLGYIDDAAGLTLGRIAETPGSLYGAGTYAETVILPTGVDRLTVTWWRNRPTKQFRRAGGALPLLGRADLEGPGELLVDAADEIWSSWLRDIRIARARLIVPDTFLEVDNRSGIYGAAFDDAREVLTGLNYTQLRDNDQTLQAHQFLIRASEHEQTMRGITREITQAAGWSLSSYGDGSHEGGTATATEVIDRATLSERTRGRKFLHMQHALIPLAEALLDLDRVHHAGPGLPATAKVEVRIPEVSHIDPEKEALRFQYLRGAQLLSIETGVRELHPDWDDEELGAEVKRIAKEAGLTEEDAARTEREPGDTEEPGTDTEAADSDTDRPESGTEAA